MITVTATLKRNNGNAVIYYKEDGKSKNYTGHWSGRYDHYSINRFPEKGTTFKGKDEMKDYLRNGGDNLIEG